MGFAHTAYLKTRGLAAGLTVLAMIALGFILVLFSPPQARSFVARITGASIAHADDPSDGDAGGGGSDGNDGCGDGGDSSG